MAVIQKTLFAKNLDRYNVLVDDTELDSKYFKVTELPDTFTGGKNAFLIAGSKELVPDTKIQIELKDSAGNIIYHEPGEGYISSSLNGVPFVSEYYEGVSKVVSVYVYPDTAYGACTLTILGELSEYTDTNGIVTPVGLDWENKYNVKWTKTINVNPALANTTKIRFYQRPTATISEILSPIYRIVSGSKVDSGTNQSFANIKLSKLETFAGDVKRVKVFRTSQGDISDYDLIQDILVESKELLTSYGLSGSVVGQTGILTSETLKNYWNTGSLNTYLTSSRVESGVALNGSGYFTYTSSLDIKSANTYELNLDAFYSSSTNSNLGIYLVSGSSSSSIGTLYGISPTKNLLDTIIPFKINNDYTSASLYFSQSQGEWHLGNISLKLSQDTAFSPDEISFVTTMPTIIGNETYNFKFEFYDVNNNYVPVAVTQSATFTGGTNTSNTSLLISASTSQSLAALYTVSASISGTIVINSGSVSGSIYTLSGSVSGTIGNVSSSVSGTIGRVSGSISGSLTNVSSSVSGTIYTLSSSISQSIYQSLLSSFTKVQNLADGNYSGSFISGNIIYAPVIGGQLGYFSTLFKVGKSPNSIYLDARQTPRKIFIGGAIPSGDTEYSGAYNNTNTNVYLDSTGKFSLGTQLTFDGSNLTVNGSINITGGNAATNSSLTASLSSVNSTAAGYANNAVASGSAYATAVDDKVFTNTLGRITKTPTPGSTSGLYLGQANLGYYDGARWKTYMDNTGLFYLTGSAGGNALLWDGSTLTIKGNLSVGSSVPNSVVSGLGSLALSSSVSTTQVSGLGALAVKDNITLSYVSNAGSLAALSSVTSAEIDASAVTNAKLATDAVSEAKIAINAITSGKIAADAVIASKIAADAVTADKIIAGAITAAKISAGAIEADKIAAGAITAAKISAGAIEADKIAAGAITAAKISAGAVTADKISVTDLQAIGATIGGWNITGTGIQSTDAFTRMRSDNKEFAVMESTNVNYYKVRIGAGTTFQSQPYHPFTEINESGIKMGGIVDTNGNNLSVSVSGYNDVADSRTGVSVAAYSSINYTTNQYTPIYSRIITNNSGVSSGVAAGEFVGGIIARNDTTPGASDAINQGFAIITDGHNYLGGAGKTTQIANPFFALSDVYLRGLALNPSGAGTNYTIKADTLTNGKLFQSSSSRKTKNIYGNWKIGGVLENIKKVPVKRFKYKNWADDEVETFGLIAEDLHNNDFWQSVIYDADKNNKAIYTEETVAGIDYEKVTSILWKSMQELLQKVEDLETQLKNK